MTISDSQTIPAVRYHYMDNLRALAMLLGIFFHAAIAYSPMFQEVWLPANSSTSLAMDAVAWFTHLFRMPLFFLIAGFFTCYMIEKRGIGGLLKNRALRIALPFIIFLPLITVSFIVLIGWALANVDNPSPILQFIAMMANVPDAPKPPPSTTHLWFLYNLVQFYLIYALLHHFGVLSMRWTNILGNSKFVVFILPLLMGPALFSQSSPYPAPEQFLPQLWSFGYFGLFFLLGSHLFKNQSLIDTVKPYAPWLLLSSIVMYVFVYRDFPGTISLQEALAFQGGPPPSWPHLGIAILEAYISVHMTIVCLVAGKALLDKANAVFRYIADSSYWVYIIHLPVLWAIQFKLLDTDWNLWVEFAIASFGTLLIGFITYVVLVRYTPIGWMLNGKR